MSRTARTLVALVGVPLLLVVATWFDSRVMRTAMTRAAAEFDRSGLSMVSAVGSVLVAGSVLLVGWLAWRAASALVGLVYTVVGGFIVALPWLAWTLATSRNGASPVLPGPLARLLGDIYLDTAIGPLNAASTIGAAMLVVGIATVVRWLRQRRGTRANAVATASERETGFP